jgi:hypothetical protein
MSHVKQSDPATPADPVPNLYADRDPRKLEPYYSRHALAMTAEGLHAKHAIAEELAWRDQRIATLEAALVHHDANMAELVKRFDVVAAERDAVASVLTDEALQHDPHKGPLSLAERAKLVLENWQGASDAEDVAQTELTRLRSAQTEIAAMSTEIRRANAAETEMRKRCEAWERAVPRCGYFGNAPCPNAATQEQFGGMCDEFNLLYWCDEHADGKETSPVGWAHLLREGDGK